jgi:hypothetical protein
LDADTTTVPPAVAKVECRARARSVRSVEVLMYAAKVCGGKLFERPTEKHHYLL